MIRCWINYFTVEFDWQIVQLVLSYSFFFNVLKLELGEALGLSRVDPVMNNKFFIILVVYKYYKMYYKLLKL